MGGYPGSNRELTVPHTVALPIELYPPYLAFNTRTPGGVLRPSEQAGSDLRRSRQDKKWSLRLNQKYSELPYHANYCYIARLTSLKGNNKDSGGYIKIFRL